MELAFEKRQLDLKEFVRHACAKRIAVDQLFDSLSLIKILLSNAALGETRDLKFSKPAIQKSIVNLPLVLNFFLTACPFTRETSENTEGRHEFVFRLRPSSKEWAENMAIALDLCLDTFPEFPNSLTCPLKVTLESGRVLEGNFAENETVRSVREWISHHRTSSAEEEFLLCLAGDGGMCLMDFDVSVKDAHLSRQKLVVKPTRPRVVERSEKTELQRQAEVANHALVQQAEFAKRQHAKEQKKAEEEQRHVATVQGFREDRERAELRAKRVIQREAVSSPRQLQKPV